MTEKEPFLEVPCPVCGEYHDVDKECKWEKDFAKPKPGFFRRIFRKICFFLWYRKLRFTIWLENRGWKKRPSWRLQTPAENGKE